MNIGLYILIAVVIVGFAAVFYYLSKLRSAGAEKQDDQALKVMMEWMKQMKDNTDQTRQEIQKGMDSTSKSINERLDRAAFVISNVTKELGQMQQIGKSLSYVQEFLLSAKKRGN